MILFSKPFALLPNTLFRCIYEFVYCNILYIQQNFAINYFLYMVSDPNAMQLIIKSIHLANFNHLRIFCKTIPLSLTLPIQTQFGHLENQRVENYN